MAICARTWKAGWSFEDLYRIALGNNPGAIAGIAVGASIALASLLLVLFLFLRRRHTRRLEGSAMKYGPPVRAPLYDGDSDRPPGMGSMAELNGGMEGRAELGSTRELHPELGHGHGGEGSMRELRPGSYLRGGEGPHASYMAGSGAGAGTSGDGHMSGLSATYWALSPSPVEAGYEGVNLGEVEEGAGAGSGLAIGAGAGAGAGAGMGAGHERQGEGDGEGEDLGSPHPHPNTNTSTYYGDPNFAAIAGRGSDAELLMHNTSSTPASIPHAQRQRPLSNRSSRSGPGLDPALWISGAAHAKGSGQAQMQGSGRPESVSVYAPTPRGSEFGGVAGGAGAAGTSAAGTSASGGGGGGGAGSSSQGHSSGHGHEHGYGRLVASSSGHDHLSGPSPSVGPSHLSHGGHGAGGGMMFSNDKGMFSSDSGEDIGYRSTSSNYHSQSQTHSHSGRTSYSPAPPSPSAVRRILLPPRKDTSGSSGLGSSESHGSGSHAGLLGSYGAGGGAGGRREGHGGGGGLLSTLKLKTSFGGNKTKRVSSSYSRPVMPPPSAFHSGSGSSGDHHGSGSPTAVVTANAASIPLPSSPAMLMQSPDRAGTPSKRKSLTSKWRGSYSDEGFAASGSAGDVGSGKTKKGSGKRSSTSHKKTSSVTIKNSLQPMQTPVPTFFEAPEGAARRAAAMPAPPLSSRTPPPLTPHTPYASGSGSGSMPYPPGSTSSMNMNTRAAPPTFDYALPAPPRTLFALQGEGVLTPSPAETTGSEGGGTEMRSVRAEGLLRLGMTMADRRAGGGAGLHAGGFGAGEGYGYGEDGGEWSGAEGEGAGWHGHGIGGWGRAVESVGALSLRDDVDYSRPVAARMYSQTTLDSEHSQSSHQPPDVPYHPHPHPHPHAGHHQVSASDASAS